MTDPDPFPEPNGDRAPGRDASRAPTHDANGVPNGDRDHDPRRERDTLSDRDRDRAAGFDETSVDPADIASAGRSCSAIVILLVVLALLVCVGVTARWFVLQ